jgi:HEAT repeat protein
MRQDNVAARWAWVLALAAVVAAGCSESSAEKVQSSDQNKRLEGLRELSKERSEAALSAARAAIAHQDTTTAQAAVRAMGRMASDEAPAVLEKVVREDRRPEVRSEAALAISGARGPDLVATLRKVIQTDPSPQVRAAAAISLGRLGSLDDTEFLLDAAARDADPEVQRQAVGALQRILGIGFTFDARAPEDVRRLTLDRIRDAALIRARVLRERDKAAPTASGSPGSATQPIR